LYLDQRETRLEVERLASGRRVLDLFCSDGGFAFHAFRGGASEVLGVDISEPAIRRASVNARLNGMEDGIGFLQRDVFDGLDGFSQSDWDMVILDPPALAKGRKHVAPALKGYRKLNQAALRRLRSGGILVTCSCSQHISEETFVEMLGNAAAACGRQLIIFRISGAAKDHPVLPSMPETRYLKCVFAFVERL